VQRRMLILVRASDMEGHRTTKQASNCSTDHGGGKRLSGNGLAGECVERSLARRPLNEGRSSLGRFDAPCEVRAGAKTGCGALDVKARPSVLVCRRLCCMRRSFIACFFDLCVFSPPFMKLHRRDIASVFRDRPAMNQKGIFPWSLRSEHRFS
jgi:hypothetical protein